MRPLWLLKPFPPSMEFTMIAQGDTACFVGMDFHKNTLTACLLRGAVENDSAWRRWHPMVRGDLAALLTPLSGSARLRRLA